jgi:hypothetical protein
MTTNKEGSKVNANARVCEMCLASAAEEAMAAEDECELLCVTLGSEIGDHLCEEIENDGDTRCGCSCHQPQKHMLRGARIAEGGAG